MKITTAIFSLLALSLPGFATSVRFELLDNSSVRFPPNTYGFSIVFPRFQDEYTRYGRQQMEWCGSRGQLDPHCIDAIFSDVSITVRFSNLSFDEAYNRFDAIWDPGTVDYNSLGTYYSKNGYVLNITSTEAASTENPEPATMGLLGASLLLLGVYKAKKRPKAEA